MTIDLMVGSLPVAGGSAVLGFCLGYICRKLIKLAIIGIGFVLALLAYLDYQKIIRVDWNMVQHQTTSSLQTSSQRMMDVVNNTAQEINHQHSLAVGNHIPIIGAVSFIPGFIFGLSRG